jgi:hypothetical protein
MKQSSFDIIGNNFKVGKDTKPPRLLSFASLRLRLSNSYFQNCLLLLVLLLLRVGPAAAQSDISAVMTAVQPIAHIGQPVDLVVMVNHPAGYRLIAPQLAQPWGDFEVRQQSVPVVTATGDGRESSQLTITVMAWALGQFSTPPLPLTVSNPQGELVEVTADPVIINVESVLTEDDLALRDIKPQAALPLPLWWPWLAAVGMLALTGLLLWWRREGDPAVPFIDNRLPHQIALAELDEIAASGLAGRGDFKGHYTQTTDVLRRYLDGVLGLMTVEQTTAEIRRTIQPLSWSKETKKMLVNLLTEADLVKFAKVQPTESDAQRTTNEAKRLVLALKEIVHMHKTEHA